MNLSLLFLLEVLVMSVFVWLFVHFDKLKENAVLLNLSKLSEFRLDLLHFIVGGMNKSKRVLRVLGLVLKLPIFFSNHYFLDKISFRVMIL